MPWKPGPVQSFLESSLCLCSLLQKRSSSPGIQSFGTRPICARRGPRVSENVFGASTEQSGDHQRQADRNRPVGQRQRCVGPRHFRVRRRVRPALNFLRNQDAGQAQRVDCRLAHKRGIRESGQGRRLRCERLEQQRGLGPKLLQPRRLAFRQIPLPAASTERKRMTTTGSVTASGVSPEME